MAFGTSSGRLVRVAGMRWAIGESLQSAKGEVGLDQYEVRRWDAWYRYMTPSLLARAYLTVLRARALLVAGEKAGRGKRLPRGALTWRRSCCR